MQARCATGKQVLAQTLHNLNAKSADAVAVIAVRLQPLANPAWNFRAAVIAEALQIGEIGDGHYAGHNRDLNAGFMTSLQKIKIRICIIKILCDGTVGAGVHFLFEKFQIAVIGIGLWMSFRVTGNFDMKMLTCAAAHKLDQFIGVIIL